ncbi:uncharacterized protein [Typha latifolia]|uniref:uncharacterized protein n=1 Tax=Typha latifolia TaxID=4733 RepID=UPI003C2B8DA6
MSNWSGISALFGSEEGIGATIKAKIKSTVAAVRSSPRGVGVVFVALVLLVAVISTQWIDGEFLLSNNAIDVSTRDQSQSHIKHSPPRPPPTPINFTCPSNTSIKPTCSKRITPTSPPSPSSSSCPEYFRYIYEDLRPWNATGITEAMVESARRFATFRLVVVDGRAYVEKYTGAFQTRDVFSLWGIAQLLNRYPGRVPDVDLMFSCGDFPIVYPRNYQDSPPPPIFHYNKDHVTLDILFPDWSFWGWVEVNIRSWENVTEEIKKGSERVKWKDREPYAYWKGNPKVAQIREELLKCNATNTSDWNARLYDQNWLHAVISGFKGTNLADQCAHRYKIYVEGCSWSVSQKYILACDSPVLLITTPFLEFWSRGLMPGQHYWPIPRQHMCDPIKFAVDWGNSHPKEAQEIGRKGSSFIQEEVSMDYVYQYMLQLLTEYAKLLRYKPVIPKNATELCSESMACQAGRNEKAFMIDSMVRFVADSEPCTMPPPFDRKELEEIAHEKDKFVKQVEMWEHGQRD